MSDPDTQASKQLLREHTRGLPDSGETRNLEPSWGVNSSQDARKRRRVRALQRYVLNPPMKLLVWFGLVPGHVLIETRGRRSGRRRTNVVGMHVAEGTGWIVAEQGGHAGYVRNLQADPAVRVRISRRWCRARAEVIPDDDPEARLDSFGRRSHAAAVRRFGTSLSTIRVDLSPTGHAPQNTHPQTTPGDAS